VAGLPEHDAKVICLDSGWETIAQESGENPGSSTFLENLAYVIYTSGSTGSPRECSFRMARLPVTAGMLKGATNWTPAMSSSSLLREFRCVLGGNPADTDRRGQAGDHGDERLPPAEFHRKISEFGLTVLNSPPPTGRNWLGEWAGVLELVPNIQPRLFIVGGDTMLPEVLQASGSGTPVNSIRLLQCLRPTETTITATAFEIAPRPGGKRGGSACAIGRSPRQPGDLHSGPARQPRSNRRSRSSAYRRSGPGLWLLNQPEVDRREIYSRPLSATPGHECTRPRPGPLSARWKYRVSWSCRPPSEDPRFSHRTGGN